MAAGPRQPRAARGCTWAGRAGDSGVPRGLPVQPGCRHAPAARLQPRNRPGGRLPGLALGRPPRGPGRRIWLAPVTPSRSMSSGSTCAALIAGLLAMAAPARAAVPETSCFNAAQANADYEAYGPTDVNAQTGDGHLTVNENSAGTLTVFKYPNPSYYNQIK